MSPTKPNTVPGDPDSGPQPSSKVDILKRERGGGVSVSQGNVYLSENLEE